MNAPVFERREKSEKYQVRFWSSQELYAAFKKRVEDDELVLQDTFNQFMSWFIARPKDRE